MAICRPVGVDPDSTVDPSQGIRNDGPGTGIVCVDDDNRVSINPVAQPETRDIFLVYRTVCGLSERLESNPTVYVLINGQPYVRTFLEDTGGIPQGVDHYRREDELFDIIERVEYEARLALNPNEFRIGPEPPEPCTGGFQRVLEIQIPIDAPLPDVNSLPVVDRDGTPIAWLQDYEIDAAGVQQSFDANVNNESDAGVRVAISEESFEVNGNDYVSAGSFMGLLLPDFWEQRADTSDISNTPGMDYAQILISRLASSQANVLDEVISGRPDIERLVSLLDGISDKRAEIAANVGQVGGVTTTAFPSQFNSDQNDAGFLLDAISFAPTITYAGMGFSPFSSQALDGQLRLVDRRDNQDMDTGSAVEGDLVLWIADGAPAGFTEIDVAMQTRLVVGGRGADHISAQHGNTMIYSGDGADRIDANGRGDIIYSGDGDDFIQLREGRNLDLFSYEFSATGFGVPYTTFVDAGGGNDAIRTGNGNDVIDAGSGNDIVRDSHGHDIYLGGEGADTFSFREPYYVPPRLREQTDGYFNDSGQYVIEVVPETDRIVDFEVGVDTLSIFGHDRIAIEQVLIPGVPGEPRRSYTVVTLFTDMVETRNGASNSMPEGTSFVWEHRIILEGVTGFTLADITFPEVVTAGVWDNLVVVDGDGANNNLFGSVSTSNAINGYEGDDRLDGLGGNNVLDGGAGDDFFVAREGQDIFSGGDGFDTVSFEAATSSVTVNVQIGSASGGSGQDQLISIERVIGSFFDDFLVGSQANDELSGSGGNDSLEGGAGDDLLLGDAGDDLIGGGSGDDTLIGGAGADIIRGGFGFDTASYERSFVGLTISLADPAMGTGDAFGDTFEDIEAVVATAYSDLVLGDGDDNRLYGEAGNDSLFGQGGADFLDGGSGNDTIDGGDGDDIIDGGGIQIDTMSGGRGNDIFNVDTYLDVVNEAVGEGTFDQVYASADYRLTAGAEVERVATQSIYGTDNINLLGNEFGQQLLGNDGNNILIGFAGRDSFVGYGGNDLYVVDQANERITELAGQGYDSVYTASSYTLAAGVSIERFVTTQQAGTAQVNMVGNELDQFIGGNAANNSIYGGAGIDSLYGYDGSDFLEGAEGNDALFGGRGVDRFIFRETMGTASGIDRIYDMTSADNIVFDAVAYSGPIRSATAAEFRIGTAALDADDRIIYDDTSGVFWFDADGNGAGAAILFGVINGAPSGVDHTWFEMW